MKQAGVEIPSFPILIQQNARCVGVARYVHASNSKHVHLSISMIIIIHLMNNAIGIASASHNNACLSL